MPNNYLNNGMGYQSLMPPPNNGGPPMVSSYAASPYTMAYNYGKRPARPDSVPASPLKALRGLRHMKDSWGSQLAISYPTVYPRGLRNPQGSSICYLNTIIQIIVSLPKLAHFFLNLESDSEWCSFLKTILTNFISSANSTSFSLLDDPTHLKLIEKTFGSIGTQQDIGEAFVWLLEKLHQETRLVSNSIHIPTSPSMGPGVSESSPIYDMFRGVYSVDLLPQKFPATNSTQITPKLRSEMFLTLQIAPERRKQDLLPLIISNLHRSNKKISQLPDILVIELSRHLSEAKETMSSSHVMFDMSLSLPESLLAAGAAKKQYELVSVVVRSGLYTNNGHYWICNRINGQWQWINDEVIDQVIDEKSVISASNNWCLLVYQRTY
jgi:ubiquitin C-terminal hydrolase